MAPVTQIMIIIGAHMSIAGGLHRAFERGAGVGCRAIQIFLKNSNQWKGKALTEEDRISFRQAQAVSGAIPVIAHNSYLINLASPDAVLHKKSVEAFVAEMRRAEFLGIPSIVLHPGAHMGSGEQSGLRRIAQALNLALRRVPAPVMILLETTAGQGSSLGHRFEHLAEILARVKQNERMGVCLDTCHVFAAGYDIRTESAYARTMKEFDRLVGTDRIRAFHVNDCRKDLGSRVDRHAHIGQGFIGLEAFRLLVNDRRFAQIPKILETPKGPDLEEDRMNLATLRSLAIRS
jgi:deoxyribonuclease-4